MGLGVRSSDELVCKRSNILPLAVKEVAGQCFPQDGLKVPLLGD